ncbi:MAG: hypothetical protein A2189_06340, partial [Paenibacillus sp. RIFOXYA1_FULL_44_5]
AESVKHLRDGVFLNKSDIFKIANVHIRNYLSQDVQTHGMQLKASDSFINVYDTDNNLFAYLVPLLNKNKEIGYITIGSLEDGYDSYDIFIQDGIVDKIRSQLWKPERSSDQAQLVFIPPMQYLVKTVSDGEETFTSLSLYKNTPSLDVTSIVKNNKDEINKTFDQIRNEENKFHIKKLIEKAPAVTTLAVAVEDYELSVERNYGMFVPVEYQTGVYSYGGNQMWWPDGSQKENRGCGPVAAGNITSYLAKITSPAKYGNLYTGSTLSYSDFLAHMDTMYAYINPGPLGETSVNSFSSAVERYAADKGVSLNRVTSSAAFTLDNTASYIKAGLAIDSPVATLNLSKFSSYEYEWHWMTITKYYRDASDNRWIAVSTWGERRSINYRTHFDAINSYWSLGGGFMYFQ